MEAMRHAGLEDVILYLSEAMFLSVGVRPCQLKSSCWGGRRGAHWKWSAVQQLEVSSQTSLFTLPLAWGTPG